MIMRNLAIAAAALFALANAAASASERILSIGGSVTEIVYALGEEHRLVAKDTTSIFPPETSDLPDVGYMRALSPEGVLSVNPDLIIAEDGSGPLETIEVLREADIEFVTIPDGFTAQAVRKKIETVAAALGVQGKGRELADQVEASIDAALHLASAEDPKKVMFVLSTRGKRIMASGANTAANGIIELAGGVNAIHGFEGYKTIPDEAVVAAAPDVILMMDRGGDHSVHDDELFAMPSVVGTPAAETRSVVRLNGLLLLGFGPRTADAIVALNSALYEE